MFLDDVPINYWGVLAAAVVFYVLGAIWYLPCFFGHCCTKNEACAVEETQKSHCLCKVGAYIGEFLICLVIAYVLALFIEVSQAEEIVEGITVAFWAWIGFIATTHLSAVIWGHKSIKAYFVHAGFLLVGFLVMGAIIIYMGV